MLTTQVEKNAVNKAKMRYANEVLQMQTGFVVNAAGRQSWVDPEHLGRNHDVESDPPSRTTGSHRRPSRHNTRAQELLLGL